MGSIKQAATFWLFALALCSANIGFAQSAPDAGADPHRQVSVYFIPLDDFSPHVTFAFARKFAQQLQRVTMALKPVDSSSLKAMPDSKQYAAEDIIALVQPLIESQHNRSPDAVFLIFTRRDINNRAHDASFNFAWVDREHHSSVISSARLMPADPAAAGSTRLLAERLYKMIKRSIGTHYFELPPSKDPHNLMYSPIERVEDIDRLIDTELTPPITALNQSGASRLH
jgi:predicted Zn-dependent protease